MFSPLLTSRVQEIVIHILKKKKIWPPFITSAFKALGILSQIFIDSSFTFSAFMLFSRLSVQLILLLWMCHLFAQSSSIFFFIIHKKYTEIQSLMWSGHCTICELIHHLPLTEDHPRCFLGCSLNTGSTSWCKALSLQSPQISLSSSCLTNTLIFSLRHFLTPLSKKSLPSYTFILLSLNQPYSHFFQNSYHMENYHSIVVKSTDFGTIFPGFHFLLAVWPWAISPCHSVSWFPQP